MVLFFLAGDGPGRNVENPRQVSAFHYPARYGAQPPLFARATLAAGMLFVSGTASIVGHESRHIGDVAAQADETLRNLEALLAEARRAGCALAPEDLQLKVYLRHATDRTVVQQRLTAGGFAPPLVFLQAGICRPELDVEIEAHAPWKSGKRGRAGS
jgi:enamine deaminase RidA (YjgF/YER057c/UK114 family)